MKKYDIKDNVDDLILQVCKYIKSADLSDDEDFEIKVEAALSLLAASIDFTDEPEKNIEYITRQIAKICMIISNLLFDCAENVIKGNVDESRYL
jgi:hypothetical protein